MVENGNDIVFEGNDNISYDTKSEITKSKVNNELDSQQTDHEAPDMSTIF